MTTKTEPIGTDYAIIDGQYYGLLDGKVSNVSVVEDGDQVSDARSWSMELVFLDRPRNFEPAEMRVLEMSVTLRGVVYSGRAVNTIIELLRGTLRSDHGHVSGDGRYVAAFVGIGPLTSK